ncbi:MAG: ABC transporter permease [Thermodesulfobacteriota bacterium]
MSWMYVLQELRRRHHRTVVNVLGIGIGVALFVTINAVSGAYRQAARLPFQNLGADLIVQRAEKRTTPGGEPLSMQGIRLPFSNQHITSKEQERLRALPGVTAAAPALLLWELGKTGFRTILGVDLSQPDLGPVRLREWLAKGRFPEHPGEVVVEKHFAKFHRIHPGEQLVLGGRSFTVSGLIEIRQGAQVASANIYLPLADAQTLLAGLPDAVNLVYLRLAAPSHLQGLGERVTSDLPGAGVTSSDTFLQLMGGVSQISDRFALLASLVAFGGAVALIVQSMLASLLERRREIGIMKAVGWTAENVRSQLMAEAFLQALLGGALGLALGCLLSFLLAHLSITIAMPWEANPLPAFAKDPEMTAHSVRLPVRITLGLVASSLGLTLTAGGLAATLMGQRANRMRPDVILRQL